MDTFSSWLKQRRNERGVTQEELALRLGFSTALLRKLESGERRPSGQIAALLADYFRIPADERAAFVAFARTEQHALIDAGTAPMVTFTAQSTLSDVPLVAPWRSHYSQQTNLPALLPALIGRGHEAAAVRGQLLHTKTRLLTLTGTAGVGKTHLSVHVASNLVEHFADGVFFVDLIPVADPVFVVPTIAQNLGLKEEGNRTIERVLLDYVCGRRMLLILDNFEHVLDAAADVARIMQASPWLKMLVTSREALHIRGERCCAIQPLDLPDLEHLPPLEVFARCPAVELFIERAQAVAADFAVTEENMTDVAAVCIGLEGVPLALELAAARINQFSPLEMRHALARRLNLLTRGARDAPTKHRSFEAAIAWSYNLLDVNEQHCFRHLGVFVHSFTSNALCAVTASEPNVSVSTSDMLASLLAKHLVYPRPQIARAGVRPTDARFALLETIRAYALDQLEKHRETDACRGRHADYYLALADQADHHFMGAQDADWGAQQIVWIDRLEAELDNMRAALGWYQTCVATDARAPDSLEKGLRLATALRRVWLARGHFVEGLHWIHSFVAHLPQPLASESPQLRATYAAALVVVARLTLMQGDVESVRPLLETSLRLVTELDDPQRRAFTLFNLGSVAAAQGNYEDARAYQRECLTLYRALGNRWGMAAVLEDMADVELDQGNSSCAGPLLEESLALYRAVGEAFGAGSVLESLGRVAYAQGAYAAAHHWWLESLQLRRNVGYTSKLGQTLVLLGWAAVRQGQAAEARAFFSEGIHSAHALHAVSTISWCLVGLGALATTQQQAVQAALLFGAAAALRDRNSIQLSPAYQAEQASAIAAACEYVDKELWNNAWETGYAMTTEQAVAAALGRGDAATSGPAGTQLSHRWHE